jgi:hypothetical protein
VKVKAPEGFEPASRFFLRHRITPLIPADDLKQAADLGKLQAEYLDGPANWKAPPP